MLNAMKMPIARILKAVTAVIADRAFSEQAFGVSLVVALNRIAQQGKSAYHPHRPIVSVKKALFKISQFVLISMSVQLVLINVTKARSVLTQ